MMTMRVPPEKENCNQKTLTHAHHRKSTIPEPCFLDLPDCFYAHEIRLSKLISTCIYHSLVFPEKKTCSRQTSRLTTPQKIYPVVSRYIMCYQTCLMDSNGTLTSMYLHEGSNPHLLWRNMSNGFSTATYLHEGSNPGPLWNKYV